MCNYCNKHRTRVAWYEYDEAILETELARAPYTVLTIGVDKNDDIVIVAYGDYDAVYKPKFCPECGMDLTYRKAKTHLNSLYGKCVSDDE